MHVVVFLQLRKHQKKMPFKCSTVRQLTVCQVLFSESLAACLKTACFQDSFLVVQLFQQEVGWVTP